MANVRDVVVLVGSLRRDSFTRKIALALKGLAPSTLDLDIVEIRDLPMYDQDLETETPPREWVDFRKRIKRADALLFATPEYNRSIPGCLKNAMVQPEAYVSQAGELVDENFRITKEASRQFFTTFLNAFEGWIEKTRTT
jgi:multimeric flavodoxin WrbA